MIKHNISDSDYKNIHIQTILIEFYGHFNDIRNALQLFECIEKNKRLNPICIGCIMKAMFDNGLNEHALEMYDKYVNNNLEKEL